MKDEATHAHGYDSDLKRSNELSLQSQISLVIPLKLRTSFNSLWSFQLKSKVSTSFPIRFKLICKSLVGSLPVTLCECTKPPLMYSLSNDLRNQLYNISVRTQIEINSKNEGIKHEWICLRDSNWSKAHVGREKANRKCSLGCREAIATLTTVNSSRLFQLKKWKLKKDFVFSAGLLDSFFTNFCFHQKRVSPRFFINTL